MIKILINPRYPKGYLIHTKPQRGGGKMALKHCLYELAQMFSMIDLFIYI